MQAFPSYENSKLTDSVRTWFANLVFIVNWLTPSFIVPTLTTGTLDLSTINPRPGSKNIYFSTAMTGNITLTLPKPSNGSIIKVTHIASGGHTIDVGGLKLLNSGNWCEASSNGTTWFLTSFGSL